MKKKDPNPETAVWPSGEEDEREEKKKEKTSVSSSKALSRFSSPIGFIYRIGTTCRKMVLDFSCIVTYINLP